MTDLLPRLRDSPEDFEVEEIPLYPPTGEGAHTFVHLEKTLRTTEEVARDFARAAGCRPRDVGYAGRKDRRAVARQWVSVPELDPEVARGVEIPGVRVLEAVRHPHKLRTGHLRGNRFSITVRNLARLDPEVVRDRVERVQREGLPNRYGSQRFGRDGDNADKARALLRGEAVRGDRRSQRFLLSALQAQGFNAVLAERSRPLGRVQAGDVAVVHASGGLFVVEDPDRENARADLFEISPTGPLFGTKMKAPEGHVAECEAVILRAQGIPASADLRPPTGIRLRGSRRALRVPLGEFRGDFEGEALRLRFELPAGSYATVLVEEIVGAFDETR